MIYVVIGAGALALVALVWWLKGIKWDEIGKCPKGGEHDYETETSTWYMKGVTPGYDEVVNRYDVCRKCGDKKQVRG
ncbi:hypothetical protein HQ544_00070 [Candidatus Falkowbacteria bacterium]|nr:hypothetical protein [Candidatus Falkowbacteria bacterium]